MQLLQHVPLSNYTSLRLGGEARGLVSVTTRKELVTSVDYAKKQNLPILALGHGTGIVASDKGFPGLVILNQISGSQLFDDTPDSAKIIAGSGEPWDTVVAKAVDWNLTGIENLTGIPGTIGAALAQNIRAYGQEIAHTVLEVEAYDIFEQHFVKLNRAYCEFNYHRSIFNFTDKGRYIITSVTLQLTKKRPKPPFNEELQQFLDEYKITDYSPLGLRGAITQLRKHTYPDPSTLPNVGAFFRNPVVKRWILEAIQRTHPNVRFSQIGSDLYKIPASWLITAVDLNGYGNKDISFSSDYPGVLIHYGTADYHMLAEVRDYVICAVRDTFRITLQQGPEELNMQ